MKEWSLFTRLLAERNLSDLELNFRNSETSFYSNLEAADKLINNELSFGMILEKDKINLVKKFIVFDVKDREWKMLCKKLMNNLALNGNKPLTEDEFIFLWDYLIKKWYQFVRINRKEIPEFAIQEWVECINYYVKRKDVLWLIQYCKALEIMEMLDKMWSKHEVVEETNEWLLLNLSNSGRENDKINSKRDKILELINKINDECEHCYSDYFLYWQRHNKNYKGTTLNIDKVLDLVAFFYKSKTVGDWARWLYGNRLF